MTVEVWWQWRYLSILHTLTLTIHDVSRECVEQHALTIVDGRIECVPARTSPQSTLCLVGEHIDIASPILDKSPIYLSSKPTTMSIQNNTIDITWNNISNNIVAGDSKPSSKPSCIKCSNCFSQLSASNSRFKQLPSEHWSELVDCWSCHRQEFAGVVSHLPATNQFVPSDLSSVFYSQFYFSLLFNEQTMRCVDDVCVHCKECDFLVGSKKENGLVNISVTRTTDSPGVQCLLARKMIDLMLAHSSFSFKINDCLLLKMINWTTMLSSKNNGMLKAVVIVELSDQSDETCEYIDLFDDELEELGKVLAGQKFYQRNSYLVHG